MAENKATFPIDLTGNVSEKAREMAAAVEKADANIKSLQGSLKKLTGEDEKTTAAKASLTAQLEKERNALNAGTLSLLKQGTSLDRVQAATKKQAKETKDLADAWKKYNKELADKAAEKAKQESEQLGKATVAIGGPLEELRGKASKVSEVLKSMGTAEGLVTVGAAAAGVAIVALGAVLAAGAAALGRFIFQSQNAARSANLLREGSTGSALAAKHLGEQIDELSSKVPTAKGEIQQLGLELTRAGLRGQTVVDTMNAVAQASAAGGDELGNTLKELVERGKLSGRFQVSPLELFGKGLDFSDLSNALADQTGQSVQAAAKALAEGRIPLEQGSAALRAAVEKKFGGINLAQMLDSGVLVEKLDEKLSMLTRDVDISPILKDVSELFDEFDANKSVAGAAMKDMVTAFGGGLVDAVHGSAKAVKDFVRYGVLASLDLGIAWFDLSIGVKKSIKNAFGSQTKFPTIDALHIALNIANYDVGIFSQYMTVVSGDLYQAGVGFRLLAAEVNGLASVYTNVKTTIEGVSWTKLGNSVIDGLLESLRAGKAELRSTATDLAKSIEDGFTSALKIKSPSQVMKEAGEEVPEGARQGVKKGMPALEGAMGGAAAAVKAGGAQGGGGGIGEVHLHFHVGDEKAAQSLQRPGTLEGVRRAIADALRPYAVPVPG